MSDHSDHVEDGACFFLQVGFRLRVLGLRRALRAFLALNTILHSCSRLVAAHLELELHNLVAANSTLFSHDIVSFVLVISQFSKIASTINDLLKTFCKKSRVASGSSFFLLAVKEWRVNQAFSARVKCF